MVPDDTVAAIGVRSYVNGNLVYMMDGSATRKSTLESEVTIVTGDQLHICKLDEKGNAIVIDGIIGIDLRDQKNPYLRFVINDEYE